MKTTSSSLPLTLILPVATGDTPSRSYDFLTIRLLAKNHNSLIIDQLLICYVNSIAANLGNDFL